MFHQTFPICILVLASAWCAPERVQDDQSSPRDFPQGLQLMQGTRDNRQAVEQGTSDRVPQDLELTQGTGDRIAEDLELMQDKDHNPQELDAMQDPDEHVSLVKRSPRYEFGLGKRAYTYVSEYKRLPVYNFGLGKRSRPYSFGLGKRSDSELLSNDMDIDTQNELLEDYDQAAGFAKRARPYSFGLGKRAPLYDFGLGKRGRVYSFGLGKRLSSKFNFGLGKRERDAHRFNFGLGKRGGAPGDNYYSD